MITVAGQKRLLSDLAGYVIGEKDLDVGNGISDKSAHTTDPETGFPKSGSVTVSEFYVNGKDGRRATKRTEGQTTSYYDSNSHVANTYEYARLA